MGSSPAGTCSRKTIRNGQIVSLEVQKEDIAQQRTTPRPLIAQANTRQSSFERASRMTPAPTPIDDSEGGSVQGSIGSAERKRKSLSERFPAKKRPTITQQPQTTSTLDVCHDLFKLPGGPPQLVEVMRALATIVGKSTGSLLLFAKEEQSKWETLAKDAADAAELQLKGRN